MRKEGFRTAAAMAAALMLLAALAEARIAISPAQEQVAGEGQIRNAGAAYIKEYPPLQIIQDTIIKWNKSRLTIFSDINRRGLHPVHLLITKNSRVNAFSVAGGHIFVSDAMTKAFMARNFDPNTGKTSGMEKPLGNGYEIYGHSALAAVLAHEYSHWEGNYLQQEADLVVSYLNGPGEGVLAGKLERGDGQSFMREMEHIASLPKVQPSVTAFFQKEEARADSGAMDLLDRTDVYSPGSLMTVASRLLDTNGLSDAKHPGSAARKAAAAAHIRKLSGGRVEIGIDGKMKLDGKLFLGTGFMPSRSDVDSFDRTAYVAGQLAKCVHEGISQVVFVDDENSLQLSGGMPLMIARGNGDVRFLVDKFDGSRKDESAKIEIEDFLKKRGSP